jgi:hypothetical protein
MRGNYVVTMAKPQDSVKSDVAGMPRRSRTCGQSDLAEDKYGDLSIETAKQYVREVRRSSGKRRTPEER